MTEHPNAVFVRRLLDAFGNGDIATIDAAVAPDVVWHFPGRSGRLAGDHRGRDEVFTFLADVVGLSEGTFGLEVVDVVAGDERAVVLFRGHARREGRVLDNPTSLVLRLGDGKVLEAWEYVWDLYAVDEFWS